MQVTVEVPDWMAREIEQRTKFEFDELQVELAVRVYHRALCGGVPDEWESWSEPTETYDGGNDADCPF